jgi:cathepsin L
MKIVLVLFLIPLIYCSSWGTIEASFRDWMTTHKREYQSQTEYQYRLGVYKYNMDYIENHNQQNLGFTLGMNQFGDLTSQEFGQKYLQRNKYHVDVPRQTPKALAQNDADAVPDSVDWRTKGVVGPVENEGQCGSCWAFVTAESIASACAIKDGKLVLLSVQQIIDCSESYGNEGCNGGLPDQAFQYVIANKGLDTWASYPYTAETGDTCEFNPANIGSCNVTSYVDVPSGSETDLVQAIVIEPIATAIDASQTSFQFYTSGIYYEPACSSSQLDHGVLIIGYGTQSGQDYYLVQNMWGTSWGMNGYILMSRNRDNNCGIATSASYPIVN